MTKYCICRSTSGSGFMIGCDKCEEWFHGKCVGITRRASSNIESYYCDGCRGKDPSLQIKYKFEDPPDPIIRQRLFEDYNLKKRVPRKSKSKSHLRKQCANPECVYECRQDSKYCSDECGFEFNLLRYEKFFVPRWQSLAQNHSHARFKKMKDLEQLEKDRIEAEKNIEILKEENEELECNIKKIKEEATRLYKENASLKSNDDDDVEMVSQEDVEEITSGEQSKSFCITCGLSIRGPQIFQHLSACHKKHEGSYSVTVDQKLPEEFASLYCYKQDKKTERKTDKKTDGKPEKKIERYCMNIAAACPQHSNWQADKDEVCGCPLDVMQKLIPSGNYCLELKKDCTKHYHWDKFRLAQMNMQRVLAFNRLEATKEMIRVATINLDDTYGGVIGVMLHNTIDHK